jgi:hypothetical protein
MTTNNNEPPDLLRRLSNLNPTIVVFVTLALFIGVLLLPDLIGAVLILVITAGLGWLLSRTWPVLAPTARGMRLAVIMLLLLIAGLKLFG